MEEPNGTTQAEAQAVKNEKAKTWLIWAITIILLSPLFLFAAFVGFACVAVPGGMIIEGLEASEAAKNAAP